MTTYGRKRHVRLLLATIALSGVLAACGGGGDENTAQDTSTQDTTTQGTTTQAQPDAQPAAAAADFNEADVTFVQTMIPHHEQALKMSELAAKNASSEEVKKLAADIEAAQRAEMEKMRGWLKAWGRPESAPAMDHGPGGMAGMTSDTDMAAMEKATGAEFEKLFLKSMIEHHRGAIDSAKTEQANGKNAEAKATAESVVADQTAEIERIQKLLDSK